jgi:hypothetical protein
MPLAFECPSSLKDASASISRPNDASDLGSATHEVLTPSVLLKNAEPNLHRAAIAHNVNIEDIEPLFSYALYAWRNIKDYFLDNGQRLIFEHYLDSSLGGGTADIFSIDNHDNLTHSIIIGDWKTGRLRRSHRRQMQAYAFAAREQCGMPTSGKITAIEIWLRFCETEVSQFTSNDLDRFRDDFLALEPLIGKRYNPGENCVGCQRIYECEAYTNYIKSAQESLMLLEQNAISPQALARLYPQSKALEKMLINYKNALKLALADGALPISDDKEIYLSEQCRMRFEPSITRSVLTANNFTQTDIDEATTISKSKIDSIINIRNLKGNRAKQQRGILEQLKQAGAIQKITFAKLQERKIKK